VAAFDRPTFLVIALGIAGAAAAVESAGDTAFAGCGHAGALQSGLS
jgi:hypothetical protein